MVDLKGGILSGIREMLLNDSTLDFQIRDNQVHIYYRGGKIWDIKKIAQDKYVLSFDTEYCKDWSSWTVKFQDAETIDLANRQLNLKSHDVTEDDINKWIFAIPFLKQIMDEYFSKKPKTEREYQQHVVLENNNLQSSGGTDYFIVDIEYANKEGRFDLVSIIWTSTATARKLHKGYKPGLAFIEMKFGDSALSGDASIINHVNDIDTFLENAENLKNICDEVQTILKQKRELGLIKSLTGNHNEIDELSSEKPQLILLLSAHNPKSERLLNQLDELKEPTNCDLKFAVANFMGYGLYQEALYNLEDFKSLVFKQISS